MQVVSTVKLGMNGRDKKKASKNYEVHNARLIEE